MDAKSLHELVKGSPEVWDKHLNYDMPMLGGNVWFAVTGQRLQLPDEVVEVALEGLFERVTECAVVKAKHAGSVGGAFVAIHDRGDWAGPSRLHALVAAHNAQKGNDHAR